MNSVPEEFPSCVGKVNKPQGYRCIKTQSYGLLQSKRYRVFVKVGSKDRTSQAGFVVGGVAVEGPGVL